MGSSGKLSLLTNPYRSRASNDMIELTHEKARDFHLLRCALSKSPIEFYTSVFCARNLLRSMLANQMLTSHPRENLGNLLGEERRRSINSQRDPSSGDRWFSGKQHVIQWDFGCGKQNEKHHLCPTQLKIPTLFSIHVRNSSDVAFSVHRYPSEL